MDAQTAETMIKFKQVSVAVSEAARECTQTIEAIAKNGGVEKLRKMLKPKTTKS